MAGFRTFATGEVLTAANVNNFLMKQSVMVFADADARTAALGADVVEGMLTYNLDTDQLEVFDGTNFVVAAPEPPAGIGSNVVQTVKTDTFTTSSTVFENVTGLTVTITPSSATSKVLILGYFVIGTSAGTNDEAAFVRIDGGSLAFVGDLVGSRSQAAAGINRGVDTNFGTARFAAMAGLSVIDSPASASAVTYTVQLRTTAGNAQIGRAATDTNAAQFGRYPSSLIAIEVAA